MLGSGVCVGGVPSASALRETSSKPTAGELDPSFSMRLDRKGTTTKRVLFVLLQMHIFALLCGS